MIICDICKEKTGAQRIMGIFAEPKGNAFEKIPSLSYPRHDVCPACEQEIQRLIVTTIHTMMQRVRDIEGKNPTSKATR